MGSDRGEIIDKQFSHLMYSLGEPRDKKIWAEEDGEHEIRRWAINHKKFIANFLPRGSDIRFQLNLLVLKRSETCKQIKKQSHANHGDDPINGIKIESTFNLVIYVATERLIYCGYLLMNNDSNWSFAILFSFLKKDIQERIKARWKFLVRCFEK